MERVFLSVGSNIDPCLHIPSALRRLKDMVTVRASSPFYITPPFDRPEQNDFRNGVFEIMTGLSPLELKRLVLRRIEAAEGRVRFSDVSAARTLDLDLLVYGQTVSEQEGLKLPDPALAHRGFLALPLADLAPDLVLPGMTIPLRELPVVKTSHYPEDVKLTEVLRRITGEYDE